MIGKLLANPIAMKVILIIGGVLLTTSVGLGYTLKHSLKENGRIDAQLSRAKKDIKEKDDKISDLTQSYNALIKEQKRVGAVLTQVQRNNSRVTKYANNLEKKLREAGKNDECTSKRMPDDYRGIIIKCLPSRSQAGQTPTDCAGLLNGQDGVSTDPG